MLRIEVTAVHSGSHPAGLSASAQVDEALAAIGFQRGSGFAAPRVAMSVESDLSHQDEDKPDVGAAPVPAVAEPVAEAAPASAPVLKRERGKALPPRMRRTKEEIAEDEAADAADKAAEAAAVASAALAVQDRPQISTNPEDRVAPELLPLAEGPLTHENLRAAYGEYIAAFGMPRAVADIPLLIGGKLADIPENQEALATAISKIRGVIANPAPLPAPAPEPAKPLTLNDVTLAYKPYWDRFGKEATIADGPRIMGYAKTNDIPNDQAVLRKLVDAWAAALTNNPFERKAVA